MLSRILALVNAAIVIGAMLIALSWLLVPPSHDRQWREDYARLPQISQTATTTSISNVRDWSYATSGEPIMQTWRSMTVDINALERTYFILEPFYDHEAIAHTMLAFSFSDDTPTLVASIEARREVGETYRPLQAMLIPTYEYLYVWSTERDAYANSTFATGDELYRYPLELPLAVQRTLLSDLMTETASIAANPRWYNTLTANCTNELARVARSRYGARMPVDIAWYLPGYSVAYLTKLGYIRDNDQNLSHISPLVRDIYTPTGQTAAEFSHELDRSQVPRPSPYTAVR